MILDITRSRVLVVAAHPDDEVLGAGATIARLWCLGAEVWLVILGEGPRSRDVDVTGISQRIDWARAELGIANEATWPGLPDQRFDTVGQLAVNKIVEEAVGRIKPEVVLCHDATDLNTDHAVAHRATMVATRPQSGVAAVLAFEVACSSEWAFASRFRPNVFVAVTEADVKRKLKALAAYGEVRSTPHPQAPEAIWAAARSWGAVGGVEHAEAFRLLRGTWA